MTKVIKNDHFFWKTSLTLGVRKEEKDLVQVDEDHPHCDKMPPWGILHVLHNVLFHSDNNLFSSDSLTKSMTTMVVSMYLSID